MLQTGPSLYICHVDMLKESLRYSWSAADSSLCHLYRMTVPHRSHDESVSYDCMHEMS